MIINDDQQENKTFFFWTQKIAMTALPPPENKTQSLNCQNTKIPPFPMKPRRHMHAAFLRFAARPGGGIVWGSRTAGTPVETLFPLHYRWLAVPPLPFDTSLRYVGLYV